MSQNENCPGLYIDDHFIKVSMLLYADDLVLMGDTVGNVQKLLNCLSRFCKTLSLNVNLDKKNYCI